MAHATEGADVKRRYVIVTLTAVIAIAFAMPAVGAPNLATLVKQALALAKKADGRSKQALKTAEEAKQGANGAAPAAAPARPASRSGLLGGTAHRKQVLPAPHPAPAPGMDPLSRRGQPRRAGRAAPPVAGSSPWCPAARPRT